MREQMRRALSYWRFSPSPTVRQTITKRNIHSPLHKRTSKQYSTASDNSSNTFSQFRDINLANGPVRVYGDGPSHGRPIVLLHGAMLDTSPFTWHHLMPALVASSTPQRPRRIIAFDLPRHGGSRPWPSEKNNPLDQQRMQGILEEVFNKLDLGEQRLTVIGLSMGAGLGIAHAIKYPSRIGALIAINPGGLDAVRPTQFLTWAVIRWRWLMRFITSWFAKNPSMIRSTMKEHFRNGENTKDFEYLLKLVEDEAKLKGTSGDESMLDDWQVEAYGPWRMKFNLTPKLGSMQGIPSLWIHGQNDTAVKEEVVKKASSLVKRGECVSIPNAGHLAPLDQPEEVNRAILEFLDKSENES